ncbi:MAG: PepSY domain-containing protein [Prochlorotrichaceae cyanobacterium]|jgi:uncharacterized iron-regulated membrane protein
MFSNIQPMTSVITAKKLRQLHRFIAPIMVLPILLTAITGSVFQFAEMTGHEDTFEWLLELHKGDFGILNLESIYPFLNALGLLVLGATGVFLWLPAKRRAPKS